MRISLIDKSVIIGFLGGFIFSLFSSPSSFAYTPGQDPYNEVISTAITFDAAIEGMVTAFATVTIAPIGLSAATKCFKHIVIGNM